MTEYVTFDARVEPMAWGKATYTIVRLTPDVLAALGKTRRVEGEFNEHPINLAITRAPVLDDAFLWAGKPLLDKAGLTPGEVFEARLRPVADHVVDVPKDVLTALRSGGVTLQWERLSPGKKRASLHTIETAKRLETRLKRVSHLVQDLSKNEDG